MHESAGSLLSQITLHGSAAFTRENPVCVRTPADAWSYAASLPIAAPPNGDRVAELLVSVHEGRVGVSFADAAGQNLRHEAMLDNTGGPRRVLQLVQSGEHGRVMIRTGPECAAALIEIHDLRVRPVSDQELVAADAAPRLRPVAGWNRYYGNYASSVAQQLRSLRFDGFRHETPAAWLEDLVVLLAPGEQIARAIYVSGVYEPDTTLVLKSWLREGAVFLDVGANIGLFTMLASRWVGSSGRVISVEPSPRERRRLTAHLDLNGIGNVTVVSAAAAAHSGSAELRVATSTHSGLNTLGNRFAYQGVELAESVTVPVMTLDAVIAAASLPRVDVVKLDIEGGEYAALQGAALMLRRFRPRLVIEVVPGALDACGASVDELWALLCGAGYRLFQLGEAAELSPVHNAGMLHGNNVVAIPGESV